ncbi:glycosyltransferase family 39 protein [Acetobacteraceae bacterium]|nr:glycosyltransferase family 39 protein [Acetobacteraceae bacterium]
MFEVLCKNKQVKIRALYLPYCCIFAFFIVNLLSSFIFPLVPDEAYYWTWSKSIQFGYSDHPPIIAYWIKAGTLLFGDNPLGIRFLGTLSITLSILFLWKATENLFDKSSAYSVVYLFSFTIFGNVVALIITPDTPAIFFLSAAFLITSKIFKIENQNRESPIFLWILGSLLFALSFLSKYTASFPIFGILFSILLMKRSLLFTRRFSVGSFCFFVIIMPNIAWNLIHHGGAVVKQGNRLFVVGEGNVLHHYVELLLGQAGLVTPIIFLFVFIAFFQRKTQATLFLIYSSIPSLLFFSLYPLHGRVQANWPFSSWPILLILATQTPIKIRIYGYLSGIICVALVYFQAFFHVIPLDAHYDPILRQAEGWKSFSSSLEKLEYTGGRGMIEAPDYALGAILAYQLRNSKHVFVGSSDPKLQMLSKAKTIVIKAQSIQEMRKDETAKNEKICRFYRIGARQKEVRCYLLKKAEYKKISLFPVK